MEDELISVKLLSMIFLLKRTIRQQEGLNDELVELSHKEKFDEWFPKNRVLFEPRKSPMCNTHGFCQDCDVSRFGAYCFASGSAYNDILNSGSWQELILSHTEWIRVIKCILRDEKKRLLRKK
jgi:hypothetical protein